MPTDSFYENYANKGFVFSDEILTRYALSLATKPFVILSGISGTGKTKIAQLFEVPIIPAPAPAPALNPNQYITLTVTPGMQKGERANLRFRDLPNVLSVAKLSEVNALIASKVAASDDGNVCDDIPIIIETPDGTDLEMLLYLQRASNPLVRLRLQSKRGAAHAFSSYRYFKDNHDVNDVLTLERVDDFKLKIVEVNGQAAKAEELQHAIESGIETKCFISVKSNWTDSTELFGYYNPLTERYMVTKLLRFIFRATDNPGLPFFVILDEMNLAKVEHYFSDFLSCIESRFIGDDGELVQEGINLVSGCDYVQTSDQEYEEISSVVKLPPNLFVTGTVNVDDTTYMFSPKVLDRANVIEFNEVYIDDQPEQGRLRLATFPDFMEYQKSSFSMLNDLGNDSKRHIKAIFDILKKYNLHFGYRTISEVSHFIKNARIHLAPVDGFDVEVLALDIQILQKILPKFHGNYAKLNAPIKELIHYLSGSQHPLESFDLNEIDAINIEGLNFNKSLNKLIKMWKVLSTQGFASFIE